MRTAAPCLVAMILLTSGCAALQPILGAVVSRISVERVIECAKQPTPRDKARCLGAEAMTVGLGAAFDEAERLSQRALEHANGGAGAADMSERDQRRLARELDRSLDQLAVEIDAASEVSK